MSIKSQARRYGRRIRKATGIFLPEAMKLAKMLVQGKDADIILCCSEG